MSKPLDLQDGTGIVVVAPNVGILIAHGTGTPPAKTGYARGCLFIQTDGGTNNQLHINENTNGPDEAASWANVSS